MKAPAVFNVRNVGKQVATRTQTTNITPGGLKGRVFEGSLAEVQNNEAAVRKSKLTTEDVQDKLPDFPSMELTRGQSGRPRLKHMLISRLLMAVSFIGSMFVLLKK